MTIGIQCTHCHKRYNAPASMAGKRVKCKHCGKVFAIPADSTESFDEHDDAPVTAAAPAAQQHVEAPAAPPTAASIIRAIGAGAGKVKAPPAEGEEPPAKLGDPRHGIAKKIKRAEDIAEVEIADDEPARFISVRPSVPFDFPGASELDRFAPPVLLVFGLAWLAYMASGAHPENITWPGTLKLGLYLALFFVVGFPVCYMSLKWAAAKRRFAMPPMAAFRAMATFALPFAMGLIMWLVGESITMLVVGAFLGSLIACAAVWFLFRIQPQEISTVVGATVGGLALSLGISYGLLLLVSLIMAASARSSGNNELAASPVGPTFAWDVPIGSPLTKSPKHIAKVDSGASTTAPATTQSAGADSIPTPPVPSDTDPRPTSIFSPGTTGQSPTPPNTIGSATNTTPGVGETMAKPPAPTVGPDNPPIASATNSANTPGTVAPPVTPPTTEHTTPAVVPTPPATSGNTNPPTAVAPPSPLLASITPLDVGPIDSLLFPPAGGHAMAVVRPVGEVDEVELWSLNPPASKGKLSLRREKGAAGRYILSPTGDLLAQLVAWPKLQASIWSFSAQKTVKSVPLNADIGAAELRGFAVADSLVVQWTNKDNQPDMEIFSTREPTPRRVAYVPVDPFDAASGNPSISPDGRTMAIASLIDKLGGIDLFDLTAQRKRILRLKMPLTKWVKPTGLAFSPDSRQIATFMENQGRGLITIHSVQAPGKLLHEHAYPDSPSPLNAAKDLAPTGRTLDWLDNQTLLLYGSVIIDAESGQTLGNLNIPHVRTQSIVDKETILLQTKDDQQERAVLVKLKSDELEKARKAARGTAKPKG